jgi:dephospho-CoA kinase
MTKITSLNFPFQATLSSSERLNQSTLPIIAITGGIASGKSTVLNLFQERGYFTLSADQLVKEAYQDQSLKQYLASSLPEVLGPSKEINFKLLREKFFQNPTLKKELEERIYNLLPPLFKKYERLALDQSHEVLVYEIPLLFELQLEKKVDYVICCYCSKEKQIERLMNRDQISRDLALTIISHQIPLEKKCSQSHLSFNTELDVGARFFSN